MAKVVVQSTREGFTAPAELLENVGLTPGALLKVEMEALPDPKTIQHRALAYCAWKLGDAIGVGQPAWVDGEWQVSLYAPGGELQIGTLYLDAEGDVITDKAPTYEELLERNAARPPLPAA